MALDLNYTPEVFVEDITKLTEKEWLAYRKKGLGGSDIAAVFGVSPWRTARELWLDKRGMMEEPKKDNWVALEVGHRLEELVAQVFYAKTGLAPYAVRSRLFRITMNCKDVTIWRSATWTAYFLPVCMITMRNRLSFGRWSATLRLRRT